MGDFFVEEVVWDVVVFYLEVADVYLGWGEHFYLEESLHEEKDVFCWDVVIEGCCYWWVDALWEGYYFCEDLADDVLDVVAAEWGSSYMLWKASVIGCCWCVGDSVSGVNVVGCIVSDCRLSEYSCLSWGCCKSSNRNSLNI